MPVLPLPYLAGAALALAGRLLQRVVRNPMASPSVLGITDGAAVGVVLFLWLFSDQANNLTVSIHWQPLAAIAGAAVFGALVITLASLDRAGSKPLKIILYGIALAALAKAAVTLLIILGPVYRASQALTWLTGSVGAAHWQDVLAVGLGLVAIIRCCCGNGSHCGNSYLILKRCRDRSVAGQGPVLPAGSCRFPDGHRNGPCRCHRFCRSGRAARRADLPRSVPSGISCFRALTGSFLVLAADTLARIIAPPLELPAGALTALVGAPLFLYLLVKGRQSHA